MIDLHLHTNKSDGEHSPSRIVEIAKNFNIETIAITDHDTCSGVKEAISKGRELGIEVISGIEVTAYENEEIHVLGYHVDYESKKLYDYFESIQRNLRNEEAVIFKVFRKFGFELSREEMSERYAKTGTITPGNFVEWLVDNGYETNGKEAYLKYFQKEELRHRKAGRMGVKEAIDFIKSINGIPVLAHPTRLSWKMTEMRKNIKELSEYGLMGIEAVYSLATDEQVNEYVEIAKNNNLIITLGSDYHGHNVKDYIDIGTGKNNSLVKYQDSDILHTVLAGIKNKKMMVS